MKFLKYFLYSSLFFSSLLAVFVGQKNVGYSSLALMNFGIAVLIILLFIYNRGYR